MVTIVFAAGVFWVIFLAWLVWFLIHAYGENSKYLCMYLTVTDVYNPLTARWHYLEEYLPEIVWIALGSNSKQ